MKQLRQSTLDAITNLILGNTDKIAKDGTPLYPYYREKKKITMLFMDAGVTPIEYPPNVAISRYSYTFDTLARINDENSDKLKDLLECLANRTQYISTDDWRKSVELLNLILGPEGLRIYIPNDDVTPKLIMLVPRADEDKKVTEIKTPNFSSLTTDLEFRTMLERRWNEVVTCFENDAYLASIVMMGGILEGVLLSMAYDHKKEMYTAKSAPKHMEDGELVVVNLREWRLNELIPVAHELKWISKGITDFSDKLRDYRNLIHPQKSKDHGEYPNKQLAKICLTVTQETIIELNQYMSHKENKI